MSTLHERRRRRPCKTRFRLAGCAFAGRASNPLGDYKRFQDLHSILLFRACPDASWVHAERLLHKLMPATPGQVKHVDTLRELVWHFYKALKAYQRRPDPRAARGLQARFDRIFSLRTGYGDLDKLLFRLGRRKAELLRVLERPETPLHTNASERDLRGLVIKRKISGGTVSRNGRQARDSMLGLMKTCQKLGLSFWHYLGDRLGIGDEDHLVAPLASMVAARA
uniref:IS66 family transposase n=1 Tax=Rhizobium ruizarguesonis TaxID=2081791 RepID=UPI0029621C9D|nr:transposase [Rhizobium ruizarguesonis]